MTKFAEAYSVNVNEHTEGRNGFTYLSWAWAWAEFKKLFPDATYTIWKNQEGLPYIFDENTGYMVYTTVTAEGTTHEMWLPVMDSANKAMKSTPYTYKDRYNKEHTVAPATMFDINKTVMRCLTKNLAMFGLGLYIYAGEDLPECETVEEKHICADCGKEITDSKKTSGSVWKSADIAKYTLEKFGRELCADCGKKENDKNA